MTEITSENKNKKQEIEKMKSEIQDELEKIKEIQKSLKKLTKQANSDKETSRKTKSKRSKPLHEKQLSNDIVQYKTPFTLHKSLDLVSYSKRNTIDGSSVSIFNKGILDNLSLKKNSSFDDFIVSLNKLITENEIIPNPIYKKLSKDTLIEYISKLSEPFEIPSTLKERLSEMFMLYSAFFRKKLVAHPSLKKVLDYLHEDNLACGINYAKSVQGFDHMIINVECGDGFRKLKLINPVELKYRFKNRLSWQVPTQTYNPKIFEQSIKKILSETREIGAYTLDNSGNLTHNSKSSFGRFLSETRGNGAIIKMDQWENQINEIAKIWKSVSTNSGKKFPLDEIVPRSDGKKLQNCLQGLMLEQFRLEALAENEFIVNYTGNLLGNYSISPLQEWKFTFLSDTEICEQVIKGKDFRVFEKFKSGKKIRISHPNFPKNLETNKYFTFPLIENKELMGFLHLNPQKYRIYISDKTDEIISSNNGYIICSQNNFTAFKQFLCGEIKTRFVNDIRDNLKILGWKDIVSHDFRFEHDLTFITSNPIPRDYFDRHSGEYRFHDNLHKLKANHHILGVDNVNCFALKPDIDSRKNIASDWFQTLNNRFHKRDASFVHLEIDANLIDPFLDLSKTYGHNIPNPEWGDYGELTINTFVSSGKYGVENECLVSLETDSLKLMKDLPKPYDRNIVLQKYDIYSKFKNLLSRDSIYTIEDITQSSTYHSKRTITNEIRAEYLNRQSFDGVSDVTELLVTLICKNKGTKKLMRDGKDILIMEYTIEIQRDQVNYFPLIRKKENKNTGSQRYVFEIHTSSPHVLQSIMNNLLECPYLSEEGRLDIESRFENWMKRLFVANSASKSIKKTIVVTLNVSETIWLLIISLKNMKEIEKELFEKFQSNYNYLNATNFHNEALILWPKRYGDLRLENFRKIYSFGLMGTSSKRYDHRNIFEVMSYEFRHFADMFYNKCMQLLMYSGNKPYLKWIKNLMEELGNILYLE